MEEERKEIIKHLSNAFVGFTIIENNTNREGFIASFSENTKKFKIVWDDEFDSDSSKKDHLQDIISFLTFEQVNDISKYKLSSQQKKVTKHNV